MSVIPPWLRGRDVTGFIATGATAGSDGTVTDATVAGIQTISGKWDEIELDNQPTTEEISAADSTRLNEVIIQDGTTVRCTQIMQRAKGSGEGTNDVANPFASLCVAYDYIKIVFIRGGKTWTGYFLRKGYNERVVRGKSTATFTGGFVDIGGTNPTYT